MRFERHDLNKKLAKNNFGASENFPIMYLMIMNSSDESRPRASPFYALLVEQSLIVHIGMPKSLWLVFASSLKMM